LAGCHWKRLSSLAPFAKAAFAGIGGIVLVIIGLASAGLGAADAPPGKNLVGAWSGLAQWPVIPIHMVMLRDGRVMTYGTKRDGAPTGYFIYDIWDPKAGLFDGHLTLPNGTATDIFCGAQVVLPGSGDVMMAGGDTWDGLQHTLKGNSASTIFRSNASRLVKGPPMNRERWYGTATTLPDGEVYIQGGDRGTDHPEIRSLNGTFRLLPGADTSGLTYFYPRNWVAPNGRIFGLSDSAMYYVDLHGAGQLTPLGDMIGSFGRTSTEAMYAPGKILRIGGSNDTTRTASTDAVTIDINGPRPAVEPAQSLPLPLHWANATILADGKVAVTGGSKNDFDPSSASFTPFIWNPATGKWSTGAATTSGKARLYHSTALLLADGSLLVGGGGGPGPQTNLNAEIYYPPYLFNALGKFARRPRIAAAPDGLKVGRDFHISVNDVASIARVTLVKTGSVTHSFNMDQRFMELTFQRSGNTLAITAPSSNTLATPGHYLLFVINDQGVPSLGKVLPMFVTPS
jgi:hypothetical protein